MREYGAELDAQCASSLSQPGDLVPGKTASMQVTKPLLPHLQVQWCTSCAFRFEMAKALEADAADVPDARQEFGPSHVTTQGNSGNPAMLSQDRRMCLRSAMCHMEHVESWFQPPCIQPPVPHCSRERLRTWAKLCVASNTPFRGCGW